MHLWLYDARILSDHLSIGKYIHELHREHYSFSDKVQMTYQYWPSENGSSMEFGNMRIKNVSESRLSLAEHKRYFELNNLDLGKYIIIDDCFRQIGLVDCLDIFVYEKSTSKLTFRQ